VLTKSTLGLNPTAINCVGPIVLNDKSKKSPDSSCD
jgi:hypothetical protein